ncbi:HSP20-like chaperone [Cylindrobasidium torrendii FP15055 ss-10]|uniref:HSP20-like chaperone n=1 Tax=Cylindrobasidium torrendii FP15055 ss-10 TaxID=1314674 RepID=A0A0D7BHH3_9AGAR|nr:HSP20-like chaperone [Cylindrobasidium torrendii FP15055 ss-10]
MSTFYYEPFYNVERLLESAFPRLQAQASLLNQGGNADSATVAIRPRMDLHEDSEKNTVTASFELPGIKKEDINIDVHDGRLTVSGETKISEEREEDGYAIRERRYGKFSRTLRLPQGIKDDEVKAALENGVLTVSFPKAAPESAPKKINIA